MFNEIFQYSIFGLPLIFYGGLLAVIFLLITGSLQLTNKYKLTKVPFKWHYRLAITSIILGSVHALFAILSYL